MDERTNCSVRFVPFRQRISFNVGFRTEIQQKQASIRPKVEAKKGKKSAGKNIEFLFRYYIPSFPPNENFHVYFGEEKLLHESIGLSTFSWLRFNISRSGTFPPIPPLGVFFFKRLIDMEKCCHDYGSENEYYWKPHGWSESFGASSGFVCVCVITMRSMSFWGGIRYDINDAVIDHYTL